MAGGSQVIFRVLRFDSELLDHGHDQLVFLVEHVREFLRRAGLGFGREIGEALQRRRIGQNLDHRIMQLGQRLRRQLGRREQAGVGAVGEVAEPRDAGLLDGRYIGEFRHALVRGHRERAQFAGLDMADGAVQLVDLGRHLARNDVD
jgi:hypothetical protein